jgi:ubiquinone/menaquinone biosynthesis C-methylase UbiE
MDLPSDQNLFDYYGQGRERDRLQSPQGRLEFVRTQEILLRHLPAPPATVADIGAGAGRYSIWLAARGYQVILRDLVPLHIEQALSSAKEAGVSLQAEVSDARDLNIEDESVDAVLLLGPLYHLSARPDRIRALKEAQRIGRPGSPIFVAAISRWAAPLDGLVHRLYRDFPDAGPLLDEIIGTGRMAPLYPGSFAGFCHRPKELISECWEAGLEFVDLVTVEGLGFALSDLEERWGDPVDKEALLEAVRRTERVEELLGLGPHLLLTARR